MMIYIILSLSLFSLVFSAPDAGTCQLHGDCAVLWSNSRCLGDRLGINPSNANVGNQGFNDKATSVYVRPGCTLTLFEHDNFGGQPFYAGGGFTHIPGYFNDKTTSARCSC